MERNYDYLIIGQGIAGTALAFQLLRQGKTLLVVDPNIPNTTSKVAAGLFNPITGRKPTKTWLAEDLFPELHAFYTELEKLVGATFFFPRQIYVPFDTAEKQNNWLSRSAEPGYAHFVDGFLHSKYEEALRAGYGGVLLKHSGYVNTKVYLEASRKYFLSIGVFEEGNVEYSDLELGNGQVRWKGQSFGKAIFCEGIKSAENPWFNWLDFRPAKGEILNVEIKGAAFQEIINRGCWIIGQEDGSFRVGSNYERTLDPHPTQKGLQQVTDKLESLTPLPYKVLRHEAGIRPATYDRRPFVGLHPEYPELGIFGGMGSKGISLSPFLSKHFISHLLLGTPLMPFVNPSRKR